MRCLLTLARGILAVLLLASSAAAGEVAKRVPAEAAAPPPGPSSSKATPVQAAPAPPPDSRIDTTAITVRANQELGANIDQTIADWQRELDAVENPSPASTALHRAQPSPRRAPSGSCRYR
jgi:hypothetical protein